MRKHIRFLMIFAVIGSISTTYLAGISGCNFAFACFCAEPDSLGEALSEAEAVFSGKVTAIAIRQGEFDPQKAISLDVGHAWKGVSNNTVTVVTELTDCGFPFEENREYLIYAYVVGERDAPLRVSLCSRTTPIENAQADLFLLGPGNPAATEDPIPPIACEAMNHIPSAPPPPAKNGRY